MSNLTSAKIDFLTPKTVNGNESGGDDKDIDTMLEIAVYDKTDKVLRFYLPKTNPNPQAPTWGNWLDNNTINEVDLWPYQQTPVANTTDSDWTHLRVNMRIWPVGHDTWIFYSGVKLSFDDGSVMCYVPASGRQLWTMNQDTGLYGDDFFPVGNTFGWVIWMG